MITLVLLSPFCKNTKRICAVKSLIDDIPNHYSVLSQEIVVINFVAKRIRVTQRQIILLAHSGNINFLLCFGVVVDVVVFIQSK